MGARTSLLWDICSRKRQGPFKTIFFFTHLDSVTEELISQVLSSGKFDTYLIAPQGFAVLSQYPHFTRACVLPFYEELLKVANNL